MAALDGMSSSRGKSPIPAIIRHPVAEDTKPANSGYCDQYIQPIGSCLRNAFYLPLYNRTSPVDFERNQRLAEEIFQKLQDPSRPVDRKIHSIREHFSIRDVEIRLESPTLIRIMTVRLFESKIPIRDKFLRIVLFTFNQNKEEKAGEAAQRWEPKNIRDL
ncbi:MAG: hypothetical protein HYZ48_03840, partial [Chlamydiales bacterium]|nr:hypothetical protein [Chlamydiales bacterium]